MRRPASTWLAALLLAAACAGCGPAPAPPAATAAPIPPATPASAPAPPAPTSTLASTPPPASTPAPAAIDPARLSAGDPYAPELGNAGYDVQRYTLQVALDPRASAASPGALSARATIAAVSTADGLRQIALDFVGFTVDGVQVGQASARSARQGRKLLVDLPAPLRAGAPFSVTVSYAGRPVAERSEFVPFIEHLGLQIKGENAYVVSEPDGARYWFPANDHPRDKAAFRFELTVPPGLTGVANGRLVATEPGLPDALGRGQSGDRYIWEHDQPMAPYLATIAVGRYVRVDGVSPGGVPLRSYVFPERRADFERRMPAIGAAVDWLGERFGRYPFAEFGYVMVKGLGASLETQTMVVLDENSLDEATMVHELAHMWFGDWASLDSWRDIWRNEGFATYAQMLWAARADPAALDQQLATSMASPPPAQYPIGDPPRGQMFAGDTYSRGALLAHALRQAIGDEAFYGGLRAYFTKHGGGAASRADFQAALEQAAGRPLQEVFDRWLR